MKAILVLNDEPVTVRFRKLGARTIPLRATINGANVIGDTIVIQPPGATTDMAKLDLTFGPARAGTTDQLQVEVSSGSRHLFSEVIDASQALVRYRFFRDESSIKLIFCSECDDYVIANAIGKCPIHG